LARRHRKEAVRRLLLGQLRHRRGLLAALGLASVVAAAGFAALTASASTSSVHVRLRKQKVRCVQGAGLFRREYACKTPMRLVCHKAPGRTILQRIRGTAYWAGTWHIEFSPVSHHWGANGPPVRHGRLSIRTPRGVRREEAIVSLSSGAPPPQILIWAQCR
jgi:hypothetical protein